MLYMGRYDIKITCIHSSFVISEAEKIAMIFYDLIILSL